MDESCGVVQRDDFVFAPPGISFSRTRDKSS